MRPLTVLTLAFASLAHAQDLTIKAPPQKIAVIIQNATIHPISRDPIPNGVLILTDGLIRAVMTPEAFQKFMATASWASPPTIIDAKGLHAYPGLISPYTQLGLTEIAAVPQTSDIDEVGTFTPEARAASAVNPDSTLLPVSRTNGILTAAVFPDGGTFPGQPSLIRLDGWTVEDLAIEPSLGLFVNWPNVRPITAWWMDRSEEDQLKDIKNNLETITRSFETAKNYLVVKSADASAPTDLHWEAFKGVFANPPAQSGVAQPGEAAKDAAPVDRQRLVFFTANDLDQITSVVSFAQDHKLQAVIIGGRDADQCAPLLREHNIPIIVRGTHNMPDRDDAAYDEPFTLPARLHAAGVRFCIASSDRTANERNLPYNAATAAAYGLPHDAALRAITLSTAEILGVADRLGSLDTGKAATIILTNGDPLEVTTNVQRAFIDGREIDLTNKQTKLADKYRERYRQSGQLKNEKKK